MAHPWILSGRAGIMEITVSGGQAAVSVSVPLTGVDGGSRIDVIRALTHWRQSHDQPEGLVARAINGIYPDHRIVSERTIDSIKKLPAYCRNGRLFIQYMAPVTYLK